MHDLVRLLVVDDDVIIRKMVIQQMRNDPSVQVVGEASTGVQALEMMRHLNPDVVVMDVRMPEMNGIEATRTIMAERPVPILIFSSFTTDGAPDTVAALAAGAVEAIPKGSFSDNPYVTGTLRDKVAYWGRQKLSRFKPHPVAPSATVSKIKKPVANVDLIVVAVSTGGPNAFPILLKAAGTVSCPIVVAQHMAGEFTGVYAKHLATTCGMDVVEGQDGDRLRPKSIVILPGSADCVVERSGQNGFVLRKQRPSADFAHPCADILFQSALKAAHAPLAIVMTGMGRDGSKHIAEFAQRDLPVLVQAPKTCVVDSMPQSVIKLNAATHVASLEEIGSLLHKYCH